MQSIFIFSFYPDSSDLPTCASDFMALLPSLGLMSNEMMLMITIEILPHFMTATIE